MADTQTTTPTTRREILSGIAAATAALAVPGASATTPDVGAVLEAWRAWRALEEEAWPLRPTIDWKRKGVPLDIEAPSVEVCGTMCQFEWAIDLACDAAPAWIQPAIAEIRKAAKAELVAAWKRREEFYQKIGLEKAEDRTDEITDLQSPLISRIEDATGSEPVIVAAKLDLAVSCLHSQAEFGDTPQIYIAAVIRGLLSELPDDMREKLAPIAAADDVVKAVYWPRPADVPKTPKIR